jgi:uncharacterized protein YcfJ
MNRIGILISGMLLLAGSLPAQTPAHPVPTTADNAHYGWADVLRVDPIYDDGGPAAANAPCYEEQVPVREPPAADDAGQRTAAGVLGAIVGSLLGHQVGKGEGRKAATAAGAVAGAVVGSNLAAADDRSSAPPRYTIERHCPGDARDSAQRRAIAYDVEYRYRGEIYTSRLSYDPGDRIRVRITVTPAE